MHIFCACFGILTPLSDAQCTLVSIYGQILGLYLGAWCVYMHAKYQSSFGKDEGRRLGFPHHADVPATRL